MSDVTENPVDIVEARFAATEPRRTEFGVVALGTALLVASLVFAALVPRWGLPEELRILPWLFVLALMTAGWVRGRRQRALRRDIQQASEHVQLEQWDDADTLLDRIMCQRIHLRSLRGQVFMLWAAVSERRHDHERAGRIYQTLALRRAGDPLLLQQANVALAASKLRTGELTDAVELIGRLERVQMPQPLRAACDLVRLFQQVLMGQIDDAVSNIGDRREVFRRQLSTQAGYAYGLLAAAMHHGGHADDAARLWRDATILIKPERLVQDFDLLKPISRSYPPAEHPI